VALFWYKPTGGEQDDPERIYFGARRTLLSALLLNALLWMLCTLLGGRASVGTWARVGLWALLAWSIVVTVYAVYTFLSARKYRKQLGAAHGLTDPLTGLPNRKGLMTALEGFDTEGEEFGKRVRLIDVDLMNLNKVNYEFGQMVGDIVLQDIGDVLRRNVPEEGLVGRLGGDEFLVIMPQSTGAEAEALADSLGTAIEDYRLSLGDRGEVSGIKANIGVAAYLPERASLHETVVSAKEATAHGRLAEVAGEGVVYYHVPRVTLGAFAVHRWESLPSDEQNAFKRWQRELSEQFTASMVGEIIQMLDEKAEVHYVDFVTAVPSAGRRESPARHLAERVANELGARYRDVMRADASGPETRTIEPAVDAVIEHGDGVVLVCDVISSGILERRCVKKLSAAGAHVQVVAWAAY
jgi:diguanylate cyclase (GGDEF)-like protein